MLRWHEIYDFQGEFHVLIIRERVYEVVPCCIRVHASCVILLSELGRAENRVQVKEWACLWHVQVTLEWLGEMQGFYGTYREASSSGHSPANPQAPPESCLVDKRRSSKFSVRQWLCMKTKEEGICPLLRPYCRCSAQFCSGAALSPTGWEMWTVWLMNWFMLNKYTKMWFKSRFVVLLIYDANSNCQIDQNVLMSQGHSLPCGGSLFIIYSIWRKEVAKHWETLWQPWVPAWPWTSYLILPHPSYTSEETQVWGDSVICSQFLLW